MGEENGGKISPPLLSLLRILRKGEEKTPNVWLFVDSSNKLCVYICFLIHFKVNLSKIIVCSFLNEGNSRRKKLLRG